MTKRKGCKSKLSEATEAVACHALQQRTSYTLTLASSPGVSVALFVAAFLAVYFTTCFPFTPWCCGVSFLYARRNSGERSGSEWNKRPAVAAVSRKLLLTPCFPFALGLR